MTTVLVSMPFQQADRPSIQLGLLKAIAGAHGLPVRTLHANLDFAVRIGMPYYRLLAEHRGRQLGDWLFSVEAFGDSAPDPDGLLFDDLGAEVSYLDGPGGSARQRLEETRRRDVPAYLDALVEELADAQVVGFTSTFQQNAASFALARRLKERDPAVVTIFGGANFDGVMGPELVRAVHCIDYAVVGEADTAFPALLRSLAEGGDPSGIPGVARRVGDRVVAVPPAAATTSLDALPAPDYDEYFERATRLGLGTDNLSLPFESARGCWWGAKHHCTFCGLNGTTLQFRSKSPARVLAELDGLARRYRTFRFDAVDNILDPRYLTDLLPALTAVDRDYRLFYEVKANLNRAQLRALGAAGVRELQPGIESLSSHVLALMDKGVRASQNVNLLRWAHYYGISVSWNILWGFPGETAHDYATQAAAIRHLVHLPPPVATERVWMERFSPLFDSPGRFPTRWRRPESTYRHVYPQTVDLEQAAYFFEYELEDTLDQSVYTAVRSAAANWSTMWATGRPPRLEYRSAPGFLQIYDHRPGRSGTYTFGGTIADVYLAYVERPRTVEAVHRELDGTEGRPEPGVVSDVVSRFAERGLMFVDDDLAVALALPATPGR